MPLDPILAHLRGAPSRTWSLIITLYGDAIVPRGGSVWLGTLLAFFRALDIGDGVVRTAMSRLAADGWLERNRVGRNSFYRLAAKGEAEFAEATRRIYSTNSPPWPGHFCLLLPDAADKATLEQAGCGSIAPGVFLAAHEARADGLQLTVQGDAATLRALAERAWPLAGLAEHYAHFVASFTPLRDFLDAGGTCAPLEALAARVLLIHQYRRIVLRDPLLPDAVLPGDWPGRAARALCATVYRALLPASEAWLDANAIDESGAPLPRSDAIFQRFSR
ncbi:MAG: phenylacetic acid degradation operon negative regulatory protein PaaX [Rhodospirillales bacterium 20-64-7]|nr:MAG: phenylacetic acid degradation operon negative regulatory protein PaaX [Rhodospirillales bacterium 20-64-7]HQT76854.1 phenylacetic acid degradation operon negative regulatory protein PaaX [Rhodopila sp.]